MTESKTPQSAGSALEIEENQTAPEIYATEATYFGLVGTNVTITLTSLRWDNGVQPPVLKRVVVGRLVMPATAAQTLTVSLYDHLTKNGQAATESLDRQKIQ